MSQTKPLLHVGAQPVDMPRRSRSSTNSIRCPMWNFRTLLMRMHAEDLEPTFAENVGNLPHLPIGSIATTAGFVGAFFMGYAKSSVGLLSARAQSE